MRPFIILPFLAFLAVVSGSPLRNGQTAECPDELS
jgi:hypothetical protein